MSAGTGSGGPLASLNTSRNELIAQRDKISNAIEALDAAITAMGGSVSGGDVARPGPGRSLGGGAGSGKYRPGSLKAVIERVLASRGSVMSVKEITGAVTSSGYKSKNKTLDKSVGIALGEMPNAKRVSRGQYRIG